MAIDGSGVTRRGQKFVCFCGKSMAIHIYRGLNPNHYDDGIDLPEEDSSRMFIFYGFDREAEDLAAFFKCFRASHRNISRPNARVNPL